MTLNFFDDKNKKDGQQNIPSARNDRLVQLNEESWPFSHLYYYTPLYPSEHGRAPLCLNYCCTMGWLNAGKTFLPAQVSSWPQDWLINWRGRGRLRRRCYFIKALADLKTNKRENIIFHFKLLSLYHFY